ncbi:MAG: hypothetical protein EKK48_13650 [Candidatus Melainabacteria bacterium]|nr:MAG: hypothetical protein EKK48_13650 [Candidatus Melainabacteria bacterium]
MLNTKTTRLVKTILFSGLLCFFHNFSVFPETSAQARVSENNEVFFGPALISSCKEIILQPINSKEPTRKLSEGDKSFKEAKVWLSKNILTAINHHERLYTKFDADYSLHLFSGRTNGMMGLLMSIHLSPELLNPNYPEKIEELRLLMNSKTNPRDGQK